jgi:diguanylate cyclase (GGDEF)-like protein/PAS domain S-box-containing protein
VNPLTSDTIATPKPGDVRERRAEGSDRSGQLLAAFWLFASGVTALEWVRPLPGPRGDTVVDFLGLPIFWMVGLFCLHAARSRGLDAGSRRAWTLLALARFSYAAGDLFWMRDSVFLGLHPPLSLASFGYLAFHPCVFLGLLSFPRVAEGPRERAQFWLDAATVFLSGAMALQFLVGPLSLGTGIMTAYVLGDVVLVMGLAVAFARQPTPRTRFVFLLLGTGILFVLAADLLASHLENLGLSESVGSDTLFVLDGLLTSLAAYLFARRSDEGIQVPLPAARAARPSLVPYASVALGYALLLSAVFTRRLAVLDGLALGACALTAIVAMRQLVTARQNMALLAREAVQKTEARFVALVQNSSDVIILVDASGIVKYETPSAERILGFVSADLLGVPLAELVAESDGAALGDLVERAKRGTGATGPAELRLKKKDGGSLFMEVTVTNLLDNPDLAGLVFTLRDTHERKLLEERLTHQAFHDPLTGLANRALLADRLGHALVGSRRVGRPLALLLLDLDNFKAVNDSFGHGAGDQVLVEVGRRIGSCVRECDTPARLGGDEFAVLLEDIDGEEMAVEVTARLSRALRAPLSVDGNEVFVGASIGIVVTRDRGETAGDMFRNADVAMYAAKRHDKGRFRLFETDMRETARGRIELEADLRHALERAEMVLHFQPMVRLATGDIVGGEALLRWRHPRRGLLPPGAFIPLAEETDLIVPIGRWVLDQACRYAAAWPAVSASEGAPRVSVNLSGRQLQRPVLVSEVRDALRAASLSPERLILEVTESMPLLETPTMAARLRELRDLGVSLAIDDFGTGYSSLSYLRLLPMDILKIDRSFVEGIASEGRGSPLLRGIVDLAKAMNLSVTAEGIETEAQAAALREFGCDCAQGYLFSRPLEAEAFLELVQANDRLPVALSLSALP